MTNRVSIAVGASLAAHALLVGGLWLVPSPRRAVGPPAGDGRGLQVTVVGWERPKPAAPGRGDGEYIPVDVQPTLAAAPVVSGVPTFAASPGGSGSGSGPGGSSLLSAPAAAKRVVFVVDRSISMGLGGGLQRARAEVLAALNALPGDAHFQIVAYNQSARMLVATGLVPASTLMLERAALALDGLTAEGRTDHAAGLRAGLALRPDVLFLITDADDVGTGPRLPLGPTLLNVVELGRGRGQGEGPLARLARGSGGSYRRVAALP